MLSAPPTLIMMPLLATVPVACTVVGLFPVAVAVAPPTELGAVAAPLPDAPSVPEHTAPEGQHATWLALSGVQMLPD